MFDSTTAQGVWQPVRSGTIELTAVTAHTVCLDNFGAGVAAAKQMSGFELAVVVPAGSDSLHSEQASRSV